MTKAIMGTNGTIDNGAIDGGGGNEYLFRL
jgi:hypothetical protein